MMSNKTPDQITLLFLFQMSPSSYHELIKESLFGRTMSETQTTNYLVLGAAIFTGIQFIISFVIPAPYGRYATSSSKFLNCKYSDFST